MSLLRPNDPTTPPDPLGSRADIHVTGLAGVLTLTILIVLQLTVFQHTGVPTDVMFWISPVASYMASVVAGITRRHRLLKASQGPLPVPVAHLPGEDPNAAHSGP